MKRGNKGVFVLALAVAITVWFASPAVSQDKPADNMQILLEKIRADKKLLVAANMELTEPEAKAFWPLYQKYQDELFLLRARTARLIKDYAEAFKEAVAFHFAGATLARIFALAVLHQDFLVYRAAYPYVRSFFVYFHATEVVLSSETVCGSTLFHELYLQSSIPSSRDWRSVIDRPLT